MGEYSLFFDELERKYKSKNIPFRGEFEFTPKCNLRCYFCYVSNCHTRNSETLTTQQWKRIIEEAVNEGMVKATFTGGEIFTRSDFEEIYNFTYDLGVRILILTNGLLANKKIIDIFKKRPPEGISMSFYGASNETYEKICGIQKGYDKAIKAIELMLRNNMPLSLKIPALPQCYSELKDMKKIANKYNLRTTIIRYFSPMRHYESVDNMNWRLSPKQILRTIDIVETNADKLPETNKNRNYDMCNPFSNCNIAKGRFAVSYDGQLMGCLSYTEVTVNLLNNSFHNALKELREKISNNKSYCKSCLSCQYIDKCSKCPGLNFAETGSIEKCSKYRKELAKNQII